MNNDNTIYLPKYLEINNPWDIDDIQNQYHKKARKTQNRKYRKQVRNLLLVKYIDKNTEIEK